MTSTVPDFTETEIWVVRQTLQERYGKDVPVELGDSEIRLHSEDRELTLVPCLFWAERNANFVIFKSAKDRFRGQFFYRGFQQYGTGKKEYDELGQCVITLLQVQSDHERKEQTEPTDPGPRSKDTGSDADSDSDSMPYYWGD
jgi:hypothetical protein